MPKIRILRWIWATCARIVVDEIASIRNARAAAKKDEAYCHNHQSKLAASVLAQNVQTQPMHACPCCAKLERPGRARARARIVPRPFASNAGEHWTMVSFGKAAADSKPNIGEAAWGFGSSS